MVWYVVLSVPCCMALSWFHSLCRCLRLPSCNMVMFSCVLYAGLATGRVSFGLNVMIIENSSIPT